MSNSGNQYNHYRTYSVEAKVVVHVFVWFVNALSVYFLYDNIYNVYFCCSSLRNIAPQEQYVRPELVLYISTCNRFINRIWHNFVDQKLWHILQSISKEYKFISSRSQFQIWLFTVFYLSTCHLYQTVWGIFLYHKCLHNKLCIYACL